MQITREGYTTNDEGGLRQRRANFRVNAMGIGVDPQAEASIRPIRIIAGRAPEADDEVVLDATLAGRLTWAGSLEEIRKLGVLNRAAPLIAEDGEDALPPAPPAPPSDATEAEAFNALQGVRLGDTLTVRRLFGSREIRVVGMSEPPPLGGRPQAFMTLDGLRAATGRGEQELTQVDI